MDFSTLSSAGREVPYMRMTDPAVRCQEPISAADFKACRVPGGVDLWTRNGFYSPGVCFVGYIPHCTQTVAPSNGWPLREGETAVRCIPEEYDCNAPDQDQRYATTTFGTRIISAPAFEIRWRSEDLKHGTAKSQETETSLFLPTSTITLDEPNSTDAIDGSAGSAGTGPITKASVTRPSASATLPRTSTSGSATAVPGESHLGAGYVAAIAAGTVFGVLACVLAAVLWMLKRRSGSLKGAVSAGPGPTTQQSAEMQQRRAGPRELPADAGPGHVLGPFEMATGEAALALELCGDAPCRIETG